MRDRTDSDGTVSGAFVIRWQNDINNIKIENTAAGRQNERISRWEDY